MNQLFRPRFIRSISLLLLFIFLLLPFQQTAAQAKSFYWERFDVDMTLLTNGNILVEERQVLVFSGAPFTFGFREIPTGLNGQNDGIVDISLRESNQLYAESFSGDSYTYQVSNQDDMVRIDWYFPPAIGRQEYIITYTLINPIIVGSSEEGDGDQIFWKPLPPDILARIDDSRVTIQLPPGIQPQRYIDTNEYLVEGALNGDTAVVQTSVSETGQLATFELLTPVFGGDQFEVRLQFPHGILTIPTPDWQRQMQRQDTAELFIFVLALMLLCVGPLGVLALWYWRGRDPELSVVVPDYLSEPPSNLPPALAGTLIDEKADMRDIISTLVDLARRGYLEIREEKSDHIFVQTGKAQDDLSTFERTFLRRLMRGKEEQKLSNLKNRFYTAIPQLQKQLYADLVKLDYVPASPDSVRNQYSVLAGIMLAGAVGSFILFGAILPEGAAGASVCVAIVLGLTAVLFFFVARHMPRKTAKGAEEAAKWKAFKQYLERIESYENIKEATDRFEQYLPYATAFGMERSWIRKFSKMTDTPPPPWYYPYGGRPVIYGIPSTGGQSGTGPISGEGSGMPTLEGMSGGLTGGLESMSNGLTRMLNSAASTMRSAPSSSSGSSGGFSGGFSGGGGFSSGGGGGGGFG